MTTDMTSLADQFREIVRFVRDADSLDAIADYIDATAYNEALADVVVYARHPAADLVEFKQRFAASLEGQYD